VKVSPVDLNLLAVLDAILQTRSVTHAAARVGITKAAMSHALARLRDQLGDPVLVRAGQAWHLSERAKAMTDRVHELAEGARAALTGDRGFDPATSARTFTIHATDHMLALAGAEIGAAVAHQAPGVTLCFLPVLPDDAAQLRGGHVDLALGVFPGLPAEFRTQALVTERFACVVRKAHPAVDGKLTLASFLALDHVLVAPRGRTTSVVDDALAERRLTRKVTRLVPYFLAALDLVSRSDCIVTMSERLAQAFAHRLGLQVVRPPIALPSYTIAQVWHPRVNADPSHVWLRRRIVEVCRALAAGPGGQARRAPRA
jgi:DNA-binding transcriptional LysR family regulator